MTLVYVEMVLVIVLAAFLFKLALPYLVMGILVYVLYTFLRKIPGFLGYPQSRATVAGGDRTAAPSVEDNRRSQQTI